MEARRRVRGAGAKELRREGEEETGEGSRSQGRQKESGLFPEGGEELEEGFKQESGCVTYTFIFH